MTGLLQDRHNVRVSHHNVFVVTHSYYGSSAQDSSGMRSDRAVDSEILCILSTMQTSKANVIFPNVIARILTVV